MKQNALWYLAASAMTVLTACAGDLTPAGNAGDTEDPRISAILDKIGRHKPSAHIMPVHKQGAAPTNFAATLQYYGGRVMSNVQVEPVFWGPNVNSTLTAGIEGFYQAAVAPTQSYWSWLTEYNTAGVTPVGGGTGSNQTIGSGTVLSPVPITPAFTGTTIDDTNIQAELKAQIKAGKLPQPVADAAGNDNTYYPIFFPQGVTVNLDGQGSCSVFCAYHGTVAADAAAGTPEFYYGVHMDLSPGSPCNGECGGDANPFNDETSVASHELVEATTDAEVGLAQVIGPPLAWYDTSQGEIGDICNAEQGTITDAAGKTYVVQKQWSNQAGACIVGKGAAGAVTATITSPANGATVKGTVTIAATAATTWSGATISSVAFYDGATLIGTDTSAPYSASWDTTKVADGGHSLTAKATDSGGHTGISPAIGVTVSNGATGAVTATITAPANGATVSGTVTVSGTAATTYAGASITSVAFFDGTTVIGTATTPPYSVSWDTTKVADGSHSLTATATDSGGHTGTSAAVVVTVSNGGGCANIKDPGNNGSFGMAYPLPGTCATVTGVLTSSSDQDFFKVSVAGGQALKVNLTQPSGALFFLLAYNASGGLIGFGLNQLNINNSGASPVTYVFAVVPLFGAGPNANYTLAATW